MALEESVRIRLYSIEKFGYFERGSEIPAFGNTSELLRQLFNWVADKNVNQTVTYAINPEGDRFRTFCHDIQTNDSGDYLISTWNETLITEGNIAAIAGDQPTGNADIDLTQVPEGHIPGYPTYFWFIPEINKFATLLLRGNRKNGVSSLKKYLHGFMTFYSDYVKYDEAYYHENISQDNLLDGQLFSRVIGYTDGRKPITKNLYRWFEPILYNEESKPAELAKRKRELIRKVHYKTTLEYTSSEDRNFLGVLAQRMGLSRPPEPETNYVNLSYEFTFQNPSIEEIEGIVGEWTRKKDEDENEWEDVGFELAPENKNQKTIWLNRYLASDIFNFRLSITNSEIVNTLELLNLLTERKTEILERLSIMPDMDQDIYLQDEREAS